MDNNDVELLLDTCYMVLLSWDSLISWEIFKEINLEFFTRVTCKISSKIFDVYHTLQSSACIEVLSNILHELWTKLPVSEKKKKLGKNNHCALSVLVPRRHCSNFLPRCRGLHFFSPRHSFTAPLRQAVTDCGVKYLEWYIFLVIYMFWKCI